MDVGRHSCCARPDSPDTCPTERSLVTQHRTVRLLGRVAPDLSRLRSRLWDNASASGWGGQ